MVERKATERCARKLIRNKAKVEREARMGKDARMEVVSELGKQALRMELEVGR